MEVKFQLLERIATALEHIEASITPIAKTAAEALRREGVEAAAVVAGGAVGSAFVAPPAGYSDADRTVETLLEQYEARAPLLTLEQMKTVTAVFKSDGHIELVKEALADVGAVGLSGLSTRDHQNRFLVALKAKAQLTSKPQDVFDAINAFNI